MVVRRGQAGCLADRAVHVGDDTARPAHDVMMVVPDAPLVSGGAAGRLDAADQARRGERVQGVIYGLHGHMAYATAHPGCDRLGTEMVTPPDGFEQCDADRRHPQAGPAQLPGGGWNPGCGHQANLPV